MTRNHRQEQLLLAFLVYCFCLVFQEHKFQTYQTHGLILKRNRTKLALLLYVVFLLLAFRIVVVLALNAFPDMLH